MEIENRHDISSLKEKANNDDSAMPALQLAAYKNTNDWYCKYGVQVNENGPDTCKAKPKPPTAEERRRMDEAVKALNDSLCPYGVKINEGGPDTCKPKPKPPTPEEQRRMKEAVEALNKSICQYGVQFNEGAADTCRTKPRR